MSVISQTRRLLPGVSPGNLLISAPNNKPDFRSDINFLRALSVAIVVFFHFKVPGFSGGFIGVDIFFVISGYLMTKIIATADLDFTAVIRFYKHRLTRIFPALAALCFIVGGLSLIFIDPLQQALLFDELIYSVSFFSNIKYALTVNYFNPTAADFWMLHTWSLAVEWQFYIFYPIILILGSRILTNTKLASTIGFGISKRTGLAVVIVVLCATSFLGCMVAKNINSSYAFYLTPFRSWEMCIGGISYFIRIDVKRNILFALSLGVIALTTLFFAGDTLWPSYFTLIPVLAAALALTLNVNLISSNLYRPAHVIGVSSYSIYLWHWPVLLLIRYYESQLNAYNIVFGILLSVFLGILSYELVEKPSLYLFRRFTFKINMLASLAAVATLAIVGVLHSEALFKLPHLYGAPGEVWRDYIEAHSDMPKDMNCGARGRALDPRLCEIKGQARKGSRVLVFGDSHAQLWEPHLKMVATGDLAKDIEKISLSYANGCPSLPNIDTDANHCSQYNDKIFRLAQTGGFDRVVLVSFWRYGNLNLCEAVDGKCIKAVSWHEATQNQFSEFEKKIKGLIDAGIKVSIFLPPPSSTFNIPVELARRRFLGLERSELEHLPRLEQENSRAEVKDALIMLAKKLPITLIDPFDRVCDDRYCNTIGEDNKLIFRDSNHERLSFETNNRIIDPGLSARRER